MLLFLAVYRRIADYGVTEDRYLMVLIGVWALALAMIRVPGERISISGWCRAYWRSCFLPHRSVQEARLVSP